jgi:hypothetical protein
MSGPENLRGVDYQISMSLCRVLQELCFEQDALSSVQFESLSELEEDLNLTYTDGTQEFIQIKKRMEGHQWTPSTILPVLRRFLEKNEPHRHFTFITDGPGNPDVREFRIALENGNLSDTVLRKFCGDRVSPEDLKGVTNRLTLRTRTYVSDNDDDPAREVRREISRIIAGEPFLLTRPIDVVIDSLWAIVFDYAKRCASVTLDGLADDLARAGVRRVWKRG